MSVLNNAPIPSDEPIAQPKRTDKYGPKDRDPQEGLISERWSRYFSHQTTLSETFPSRVHSVYLAEQTASIGATDMTDGTLSAGRYRLSYYLRITTAAGTGGSSVTLDLDWTDGVVRTLSGVAMLGDANANYQTGSVFLYVDALSPVRYTVTVAPTTEYALDLVLEEIQA